MAVLLVAAVPLSLLAHQLNTGLVFLIVFVPFAGVGTLVANRHPSNPIGWLLLLLAFGVVLSSDAGSYAVRAYRIDHHGLLFSRLAVALATSWIAFILLPLPILPISRRSGAGSDLALDAAALPGARGDVLRHHRH